MPINKQRRIYIILLAATVVIGLLSRHMHGHGSLWLMKYPGDILYATMVYWIFRIFSPRTITFRVALISIAICFSIELLKLWHTPWLTAFRHTLTGRLILGVDFHFSNLLCYVIGVVLAVLIEKQFHNPDNHP